MRPIAVMLGVLVGVPSGGCTIDDEFASDHLAIVGGEPTDGFAAVALLVYETLDEGMITCSGTLITPRVMLTAAHCTNFEGTAQAHYAYFGTDARDGVDDPGQIARINIIDRTHDTRFMQEDQLFKQGYDTGMVLLEVAAPVAPIPVNRWELDDDVGESLELIGWGVTSTASVDSLVKRRVQSTLREVDERLITYGSSEANSCQGDSGGPNILGSGDRRVIAGLTSFGDSTCSRFGVGTRVDQFVDDIIEPYVAANDPAACTADYRCAADCAMPDPDCTGVPSHLPLPGPSDDPPAPIAGACQSHASPSAWLLVIFALVFARRRRLHRHRGQN